MRKIKMCIAFVLQKLGSQEIGREAFRLFVIQMLTLVISFVPSILISRTLGPEMKGRYDLFNLLCSYVTEFGLLGFGAGLLFYQMAKEHSLAAIHGTGIVFSLIMSIVVSGIGWLTSGLWKNAFTGLPTRFIVMVFCLSPFLFYKLLMGNILLGMNRALISYIISLITGIVDAVLVFVLYRCEQLSYITIIYLVSIESVIISGAGIWYISVHGEGIRFEWDLMRKALKYGLVTYIGAMANSILFKIDLLFLNYIKGNEAVGIYSVAVRWAEMLFLMDSAIGAASLYKVGSLEKKEARILTLRTMRLQALISGLIGFGMIFLAYPMILFIYGEAYVEATYPLIILLPGIVCWSVGKIASQYVVYKLGKAQWCTYATIAGSILNVCLNLFLIPRAYLCGAALASTISYITVVVIVIFCGIRKK